MTEEVKSLSAPRGLETTSMWLSLSELGNCLCLCDDSYMTHVDIWWMKKYGIAESWTKRHIIMDCILPDIRQNNFKPIVIWNDGEILLQSERCTQLVSYNTKEKKFRKVNVYGNWTVSIRYIPSFYSLKTVMGNNFKVSNVYSKTQMI